MRERKKSIACIGKHPLGNYIVVVHLLSKMNLHGFLIASQSKLNSIARNMNQYDLFANRLLYSTECDYVESEEMKSVAKCTTECMKCKRQHRIICSHSMYTKHIFTRIKRTEKNKNHNTRERESGEGNAVIKSLEWDWSSETKMKNSYQHLEMPMHWTECNCKGCAASIVSGHAQSQNQISQNNSRCRKLWSLYYYYDTKYFAHTIA